jgi:hypothetical protein
MGGGGGEEEEEVVVAVVAECRCEVMSPLGTANTLPK